MSEIRLDLQQATSILNEAIANNVYSGSMPEEDDARIKAAALTVQKAVEAYRQGGRSETLMTVLNMARHGNESIIPGNGGEPEAEIPEPEPSVVHVPAPETPPAEPQEEVQEPEAPEVSEPVESSPEPSQEPQSQAVAQGDGGRRAEELARGLSLPVPKAISEKEAPPMPRDISSVSDKDLRRLYSEWGAVYSWAQWCLGVREADLSNAEHLLSYQRDMALKGVQKVDDKGAKRTVAQMEAEIADTPGVRQYADEVNVHAASVAVLKRLVNIYGGHVERISREVSARHYEFERAGKEVLPRGR